MNVFKKQECKHCKLSKAVANDAAVQFNKAESALKIELLHSEFLTGEVTRLNLELKKWKHWWYLEKKTVDAIRALTVVKYFDQNERNT